MLSTLAGWLVLTRPPAVSSLQLRRQLAAAEAAAAAAGETASSQHQAQLEGLSAGHAARIRQLQEELATEACRRADLEARAQVSLLLPLP